MAKIGEEESHLLVKRLLDLWWSAGALLEQPFGIVRLPLRGRVRRTFFAFR